MARTLGLGLASLAALLWVGTMLAVPHVVAAPAAHGARVQYGAAFVYAGASLICHQQPARSFHAAGVPLPVCARCTGLYVGALAGLLVGWLGGPAARGLARGVGTRRGLLLVAAPTAVTVLTAAVGLWDPANALRAAIAWPLGAAVGLVVAAVIAEDLR